MTISLRDDLYVLSCDHPNCPACVEGCGSTPTDQRRSATSEAESDGWQLGWHDQAGEDYCAKHHCMAVSREPTRLYRDGKALPYARRV